MDTYLESVGRILGRQVPDSVLALVAETEKEGESPVEAARRLKDFDAYTGHVRAACIKRGFEQVGAEDVVMDGFRSGKSPVLVAIKVETAMKAKAGLPGSLPTPKKEPDILRTPIHPLLLVVFAGLAFFLVYQTGILTDKTKPRWEGFTQLAGNCDFGVDVYMQGDPDLDTDPPIYLFTILNPIVKVNGEAYLLVQYGDALPELKNRDEMVRNRHLLVKN